MSKKYKEQNISFPVLRCGIQIFWTKKYDDCSIAVTKIFNDEGQTNPQIYFNVNKIVTVCKKYDVDYEDYKLMLKKFGLRYDELTYLGHKSQIRGFRELLFKQGEKWAHTLKQWYYTLQSY